MTADARMPTGIVPILVTPFDAENEVDEGELRSELRFLRAKGIVWAGVGFGSEVHRLTPREVATVIGISNEEGLKVVGNLEASTSRVKSELEALSAAGASAVMFRPRFLRGEPQAIVDTLVEIVAASPVTIVYQDAAAMTGIDLPAGQLVDFARRASQPVCLKIEPENAAEKTQIVRDQLGDKASILGGNGGRHYVSEALAGANGTMPGPAFPEFFEALRLLVANGERAAARQLHARLLPFIIAVISTEEFLFQQKHVLIRRGVLTSRRLRTPHPPLYAGYQNLLDTLWDDLEIDALLEHCSSIVGSK
ncbi:MAG: dihydrodipicolinate synthase family protein [Hyphomicrobiales bacterium]|nr:MAG: dihydrodipicolinate synthase family protein [Hyphomicrobiales bacterium]